MFKHKTIVTCIYIFFIGSLSAQIQSVSMKDGKLLINVQSIIYLDSGISEEQGKILAIQHAKQSALDQAGIYLQSHADGLIKPLDKDEIINSIGSLLKLGISNENTEVVGNVFTYRVDVQAGLDVNDLNTRINEIGNSRELRDQLEAERKRDKALSDQIVKFATPGCKASESEVKTLISSIFATEWYYQGYYSTDLNQKIEYLTKSIKLDPTFAFAFLHRGHAYYLASRFEDAINDYSKAIELDPEEDMGYINRGIVYSKLTRYDDAIHNYGLAIALDSTNAMVYYNRARAYYVLNAYQDAINDYTKAIELDPSDISAYKNRGSSFYIIESYEEAVDDFNHAIQLDSTDAMAYFNLGTSYFAQNKYEAAKINFSSALEFDPSFANAYWGRGNANKVLNEYENAANDYNAYLKLNGNTIENAEEFRKWIREMGYTPEY
ncbi:tetratricopeptide repeat protein [candidate division KSB1 bacterium]|nr:tetratricopeptide repeat protein [candidate division KSB1 bacterium]